MKTVTALTCLGICLLSSACVYEDGPVRATVPGARIRVGDDQVHRPARVVRRDVYVERPVVERREVYVERPVRTREVYVERRVYREDDGNHHHRPGHGRWRDND